MTDAELQPPRPVEETVRALSAPDLIMEAPELVPGRAVRPTILRRHWCAGRGRWARRADTRDEPGDAEQEREGAVATASMA